MKKLAKETTGNFTFEYSPESFQGTEVDYALEVCNAVLDIWEPTSDNKAIINLPTTVENAMPHVFASQVEYFNKYLLHRENVLLSLHPHNDRGSGISDAELGILAGADRIEGTLFGNGERTGNVDIITLAMNMFSQGVDPELDFSNMSDICEVYERVTRMHVSPRQPYAGELVFTAFSDLIKTRSQRYGKRYGIPIDPQDVGRRYDSDVIRMSIEALVVAVNKLSEIVDGGKDERLLEITNYIYANYKNVTLEDLSEKFFLSKPYLSKYIKEKVRHDIRRYSQTDPNEKSACNA